MATIGLYGGTFDPIHLGHLNLAVALQEALELDELWFCPAYISPHKLDRQSAPVALRFKMVEQAIEGIPNARVIDYESAREEPSYTIDTVRFLRQQHPEHEFYLLLGDDALEGLPRWKEVELLLDELQLVVGCRSKGWRAGKPEHSISGLDIKKLKFIETPLFEVSATDLRERLSNKRYCGHLIPQKVLDTIHTHALYYF